MRSQLVQTTWLKAAVIGSIWAAIEIIAGSFLHNLRLPFAGTFLSMVSVALLVLFIRHWKDRGIVIRAAIICSLMKAISPSAVILGPMTAILMEGLFMELSLLVFRRTVFAFMLGGALAVSWALVQKLISLMVLYGFDLVRIAGAFYNFLVLKSGIESVPAEWLVIFVFSLYSFTGAIAALIGYFAYEGATLKNGKIRSISATQRSERLQTDGRQAYSVLHIFLLIAGMIIQLILIVNGPVWLFLSAGLVFIVYCLLRYNHSMRYFRKPRTWIQFILLTLVAALALKGVQTGQLFSVEGLAIGLKMVFRATVIIIGFSAISIELRNPLIRNLLFRNGFAPLYVSLNLAFSALPAIIEVFPEIRSLWKQRKELSSILLSESDLLLEQFTAESATRKNIFILTGSTQGGKTTVVKSLVTLCLARGLSPAGIITHGTFSNDKRDTFTVELIRGAGRFPLARREPGKGWIHFNRFYFDPAVFDEVSSILQKQTGIDNCPFILDEIGPLELSGKGWYPVLEKLKKKRDLHQLWVVREKIVNEVLLYFSIPAENVVRHTKEDFEVSAKQLCEKFCSLKGK